jgi:hypothetical protein
MRSSVAVAEPFWMVAGLDFRNLIWVALALGVMVAAMGFLIGPVVRKLNFEARREFTLKLLPKTLFIMTPLGIIAPTSGWYLAVHHGYHKLAYPEFWWVAAALAITAVLFVQGLVILLPANVISYLEMRKDPPNYDRVGRIMRRYFYAVALQGLMQVMIIVVMVKFATGV